jgi:4-hydroxy-2-oxoheptanedioate aldolase
MNSSKLFSVRDKLNEGRPLFGAWAAMGSPFSAEIMCSEGPDYVCIDQQHGLADYGLLLHMLRAIEAFGVAPLTRVLSNDPALIGQALDAGAQGVIVPMVNNAEEAARAVSGCRYPPQGVRSFGPTRAALALGSTDVAALGQGALCLVMVETRQGLENIKEIVQTPGLDGVYIGPADLALGLGLTPNLETSNPEHEAAIELILKTCLENGVLAGIQCSAGKAAYRMAQRGFRIVTFAKDSALIATGIRQELEIANGKKISPSEQRYT